MSTPDYVLPVVFTGVYQTKQHTAGLPGQPSVFGALAHPPASGVAAESASVAFAEEAGTVLSDNPALLDRTRNRDAMVNFYDHASIYNK